MATPSPSSPLDLSRFEGFNPDLVRHAARSIEHGAFWSTGEMVATDAAMGLVLAAPALLSECQRQRAEIERLRAALRLARAFVRLSDVHYPNGTDPVPVTETLDAALAGEGGAE